MESRLNDIAKKENLHIDSGGVKAILHLSQGDMRKALNLLQATAASYQSHINELNVYQGHGEPLPSDIQAMLSLMMNQSYSVAYDHVLQWKTHNSLCLNDIIREIHVALEHFNLPTIIIQFLFQKLAQLEYDVNQGCHEKIQLASLVSMFQLAADKITHS
jgi:replication factor C subunit 3/5